MCLFLFLLIKSDKKKHEPNSRLDISGSTSFFNSYAWINLNPDHGMKKGLRSPLSDQLTPPI